MPVVWVTHDFQQAERLADDVIVLWDGHVATEEERRRFLEQDLGHDTAGHDDAGATGADA